MSLVFCGDLHGRQEVERLRAVPPQTNFLIVLGDWGVVWNDEPASVAEENRLLGIYDAMPWETLVILGNHEGYGRISRLPQMHRHGALVRQVSEKVFVLQNGAIYSVEGYPFLVFGGAESTDRANRSEGNDWWHQEIPTAEDLQRGIASLKRHQGKVDYVLPHTCPTAMAQHLASFDPIFLEKASDRTCTMLSRLEARLSGRPDWFFGHFHVDLSWKNYHCLFEDFHVVPDRNTVSAPPP